MSKLTSSKEWLALEDHYSEVSKLHLRDLFKSDIQRFEKFSVKFGDILLDYSKNLLTESTLPLLIGLANFSQLKDNILAMFEGEKINFTENRAVLHTALRNMSSRRVLEDGTDIMPVVREVKAHMKAFVESVHSGEWRTCTGEKFTDAVNIGIGGSDLGPAMVCEALKPYAKHGINIHFVSNVDGTDIAETLKNLNPDTTLFIIASKTFTTQETLANALSAKKWFLQSGKRKESDIAHHFVALSTNEKACIDFGIDPKNMFGFWNWVGGRYSLWSAIGLSIALYCSYSVFEDLLAGAYEMDEHFRSAPFERNLPVILALISIWHCNFFNAKTQAIIPYDQYMRKFPDFLQQLDMESNGKRVDCDGNVVDYFTGPVVWGTIGSNSQHSFFQLIHQGTQMIPVDFLAPVISHNPLGNHHEILLSNFFAQTEALMSGKSEQEVRADLKAKNVSDKDIEILLPHKVFPGNRPTNTILYKKLTPKVLGSLIALYEHKVFVAGAIWRINSFDQWGVELGKELAKSILPELTGESSAMVHDSSTMGLINYYKKIREEII